MYRPSDFGRSTVSRRKDRSPYSLTVELPSAIEMEQIIGILLQMVPVGFADIGANLMMNASSSSFVARSTDSDASHKIVDALAVVYDAFRTNPSPVITGDDILRLIRNFQLSMGATTQ